MDKVLEKLLVPLSIGIGLAFVLMMVLPTDKKIFDVEFMNDPDWDPLKEK